MSGIETINGWIHAAVRSCWHWFLTLNQQEWFVVLGIGAAIGFLCMRGFGSRGRI